ncbi:Rv3235 family protein [uncultured Pseudokineococcus sp.]|uniref:Rv3235 family protein n=1 Tax=uncultured Pseudokineococcus sp. TaxID=1642928 RepID=UPI002612E88D|nr:Rv3235 family protein [uncultured Pseudokineococcus sp.]
MSAPVSTAAAPPRPRRARPAGCAATPTAVPDATGAPRVRLAPVPSTEPAPLAGVGRPGLADASQPAGQQVLVLTSGRSARPGACDVDPVVAARPSADEELSDPTATCAALAGAVVEVLSGHRPAAQLVRWTTLEVHEGLVRRAALAARLRRPRAGTRGPARTGRPAVVRRVRVCRPAEGVVEASAVVVDGERVRAVAMRLEGWDRRWRATAVEVG